MKNPRTYSCVIIDDEPMALRVIEDHLGAFDQLEYLQGFTKAFDALELLNRQAIDLLFLDINMPGISGVELLRSLDRPPLVIFTTAYRNFAVDAFELDALDYLVKPIAFERFVKAVNRFLSRMQPGGDTVRQETGNAHIILKADKKHYHIRLHELKFIESLDNYMRVYTTQDIITSYGSLGSLERQLPAAQFIRIHRSCIINRQHVKAFTSAYVQIDDRKISIGRHYRKEVMQRLLDET